MRIFKDVISLLILLYASCLITSCGESKEELRQQIAEREAVITRQQQEISDMEDMRDYVDSYDLDDTENEIDNIYNESEY